jgi:hypothetical protein
MKKKIATLLILAVVITTTTFATGIDDMVNRNVLNTFNQKFAHAQEVKWSQADNYVKAAFILNNQHLSAYFSNTGELMGIARNIITSQLPINLHTQLSEQLATGWVTELFEFSTDVETIYFITVENADQQVTYKSADSSSWMVLKKTRKG